MQYSEKIKEINYTVSVSRRSRRISMRVDSLGNVRVSAPYGITNKAVSSFVLSHYDWLVSTIEKQKRNSLDICSISDGGMVYVGGKRYVLSFRTASRSRVVFENDTMVLYSSTSDFTGLFTRWCRESARCRVKSALAQYIDKLSQPVQISGIKITGCRRKWGSCSSKKSLIFSYRLAMVDDECLEYVVVHELSHLIHFNHGKEFYDEVSAILPDYRNRELKLKEYSRLFLNV